MTPSTWRELAAAIPGAIAGAHNGHEDFRIGGRVFSTLGYPDPSFAMVKLDPDHQAFWVGAEPDVFLPVSGGWGRGGATLVRLPSCETAVADQALRLAAEIARERSRRRRSSPRAQT